MKYLFETPKTKIYSFMYPSRTKRVLGFCVRPKNRKKHPVLIWNRGGTRFYGSIDSRTIVNILVPFAEAGFEVYASNLGMDDTHDLTGTKDIIEMIRFLKLTNMSLYMAGHSRGCMSTWTVLAHKPRLHVKAAACLAGVSDYRKLRKIRPDMVRFFTFLGGNISQQAMRRRSGLLLAPKLPHVPYLLVHGDKDELSPVEQSVSMAKALKQYGHDVTLKVLKGEDHVFHRNMRREIRKVASWLLKQGRS